MLSLDDEIKKFINKYVCSFLCWDLVVFFHHNPETRGSVHFLAEQLNGQPPEVKLVAKILKEKGILKLEKEKYIYAPSPEIKKQIDHFNQALNNRDLRRLILREVLQKQQR